MGSDVNAELTWQLSFLTANHSGLSLIVATALIALAVIGFTALILRGLGGRLENFSSLGETLRRFPLPLAAATAAAILFSKSLLDKFQQEFGQFDLFSSDPRQTLAFIALAAIFWFLAAKLWQESEERPWPIALALAAAGFAFSVWCIHADRTAALYLVPSFILLVTAAPYLNLNSTNNLPYWHFNQAGWLSAVVGLAAAAVLTGGLFGVFLLFDSLIGTDWQRPYFFPMAPAVFGFIWSALTLSGIPKTFRTEASATPQVLKILAGGVLVPLVIVYLAILYLYLGKILVSWAWPTGSVARYVSIYATLGVFTYLSVYPLREDNALLRAYHRFFFPALIPLLVLLAVALFTRIDDYGITEGRYVVGLFGFWLTVSAIAFIAFKPPLKLLPLSLAGLLFLASFGPWSASAVSTRSQLGELEQILEKSGLLTGDQITPTTPDRVSLEQQRRISSIVNYFIQTRETDRLKAWLHEHGLSDTGRSRQEIVRAFGFEYVHRGPRVVSPIERFNLERSRPDAVFPVVGFNGLQRIECYTRQCFGDLSNSDTLSGNTLSVTATDGVRLTFDLAPLVALSKQASTPERDKKMTLETEQDGHRVRFILESMSGYERNGEPVISSVKGTLLLGRTE